MPPDGRGVRPSSTAPFRVAVRIAAVYGIVGLAWIAFSDYFVAATFPPNMISIVQTYKGWAFIAVTAVLVFVTSLRALSAQAADREKLRQAATVYASTREGVVITDKHARIIAANPAFTAITGYEESEVIGQDPRVLKSGRQDRDWYREMWRSIQEEGYWQGEIWNRRKNGEVYPEWLTISSVKDAAGDVVNYVGVFTDITRIKHSEAQLDRLAHTDALTGLANRLLLNSRLEHAIERAIRTGSRVAVLFVDLDHFKQINDSLGFDVGDESLRAVAGRLEGWVAPADTLARLGADEFVVVREDLDGVEAAADLARDLVDLFTRPLLLLNREVHLSASVGISLCPDDGSTANQLVQRAGAAATHVKETGGRSFRFHTPSMAEAARSRFGLEADLRHALDRQEFVLYYQPRVRLATGRIEGVEALLRWKRPGRLLQEPDEFIEAVSATGLIVPLGHWILEDACRQMRRWTERGLGIRTVAVNVSPHQLRSAQFVDRLAGLLASTNVDPSLLELEITESAALDSGAEITERLQQLRALGVGVAIDDFGTGYSSLARLRHVPASAVKIDRSFLKGVPEDAAASGLIAMIVAMAGHLKLQTVAEGVETEGHRAHLRQSGCDLAQGFLFGRPMPADELTERLAAQDKAPTVQ